MKTKYLINSLIAAALLAGCSNEDLLVTDNSSNATLKRPTIDVSFGVDDDATRMVGGSSIEFESEDKIGAVLVDYDYTNPDTYFEVKEGHVGNNRFYYNDNATSKKFETDGVMVKGSWLFYLQYNSKMTTSRNGVQFDLPVIQKYAKDYSEIAKNDFRISPVVNLLGQEDGHFDNFNLPLVSVYTYANIVMKFPEAVTVQKIVVKPTTTDLQTYVPFAKTYTIQNRQTPQAKLNEKAAYETDQDVLDQAKAKLQNVKSDGSTIPYDKSSLTSDFKDILKAGTEKQQLIALDCLDNTEQSTDFQARMLIPAGKYANISLYAYTDKGVYKYDVKNSYVAKKNAVDQQDDFYLRRQYNVSLHKIDTKSTDEGDAYLNMTETKSNADLQTSTETDGTVVISQKDLVAVINGINSNDVAKIRVLGDNVIINQEVMDALTAKVKELSSVSLEFAEGDGIITIEGNESSGTPLNLHNIKFNGGAKLTRGYANVGEDIIIPSNQSFTVNAGTTLTFKTDDGTYIGIINNGNVIFDNDNDNVIAVAAIRSNLGNITINSPVQITYQLVNSSDVNATGNIMVNTDGILTLNAAATSTNNGAITNNGVIELTKGNFDNFGDISNNKTINISTALNNSGSITNAGLLLVKGGTSGAEAKLDNSGTITNSGDMYCHDGENSISNTGSIYAEDGSTTYITTNSKEKEYTVVSTNNSLNKMGEIFCATKNVDVSVTTSENQGYISYTVPTTVTTLVKEQGDKFNKVYLNGSCDLQHDAVYYVVVNKEAENPIVTLGKAKGYQEITFNADATIYSDPEYKNSVGKLTVANGVRVKIPTENAIGVYDVVNGIASKTNAEIYNSGTILVGGNFWSKLALTDNKGTNGIFASGDGSTTAFHWEETTW